MDYAFAMAGYLLLIMAIMFTGRERRVFSATSHAAAANFLTLLCLISLLWFLGGTVRHLTTH
jgi:bacteriorhodopsin